MTTPPSSPPVTIPHGEEVTTEPQRLALEGMSADLTRKLNDMVAEQEERVRIFAAQHHSLSPSPVSPDNSFPQPEFPQAAPLQPQPAPQAPGLMGRTRSAITNGPQIPAQRQQPPVPTAKPVPARYNRPATFPDSEKKESSIGAGAVTTIIFVIFIILVRSCD